LIQYKALKDMLLSPTLKFQIYQNSKLHKTKFQKVVSIILIKTSKGKEC